MTGEVGLIGEEPVAELGVVAVRVEEHVGEVSFVPLDVAHGAREPPVVGLAGDLEDPARHRDGDPVDSKLADERVHHFRVGRRTGSGSVGPI